MLGDIVPYLLILAGLVGASAFFSGTEVALFSLRRVDREQLAREDTAVSRRLLKLMAKPERLIATVLLGNELVNVSVSATMAALCAVVYADYGEIQLAMVTTFLALPLLLFLGEITPKTVAIKAPMAWARRAASPLALFSAVVMPVRAVIRVIVAVLLRPFGAGSAASAGAALGEAEFKALVDAGTAEGAVDAREHRLIHRVFEFGDKRVADVMLPRGEVFALSYDVPLSRLEKKISERGFSRVPIYHKSLDNIRGIVYAKDLAMHTAAGRAPKRLSEFLTDPLFVPQTIPVRTLFRIFKQRKMHIALVVNEYGKLAGLCTMEDLLEELFGEIRDEREERKQGRVQRASSVPGEGLP